MDNIGDKIV